MIEVEKKFQPTQEQKAKLLEGATFVSEKQVVDVYYDTSAFELAKKNMWLRNRNNTWELKVYINDNTAEEIINEEDILNKLNFLKYQDFNKLLEEKLVILGKILTERKKYIKQEFILDFDETDFGLSKLDIELQVQNENEISNAEKNILDFTNQYDMNEVKLEIKPLLYLKKMRPEIYSKINMKFENKELKKIF